jgi:triacylglycerol lipase
LRRQGTPFVAVNLEPVFGSIDDYVPVIEAAVARLEQATGLPPVAVAHSMGGLALRAWWAQPGNAARVHHAITLGTPHHGTWLARWALTRNARQMRQLSGWLQRLEAARAARTPGALQLLLQPLRQHRVPAVHRHAAGRPQPCTCPGTRMCTW